ncbi:hypothetical protein ACI2OX_14305 [Bacillus sp. N9]
MNVTLARTGKQMKLSQSTQFLADDRTTVNAAVSGDIIGLYDTGTYQIGDTLFSGKMIFSLKNCRNLLPNYSSGFHRKTS